MFLSFLTFLPPFFLLFYCFDLGMFYLVTAGRFRAKLVIFLEVLPFFQPWIFISAFPLESGFNEFSSILNFCFLSLQSSYVEISPVFDNGEPERLSELDSHSGSFRQFQQRWSPGHRLNKMSFNADRAQCLTLDLKFWLNLGYWWGASSTPDQH